MTIKNYNTAYASLVGPPLALVFGPGILVAGLWPFHVPGNQVKWRENDVGLEFGRHGSVLSAGAFPGNTLNDDSTGSIEIWLNPGF